MAQDGLPNDSHGELDRILTNDSHHVHSFADLWALRQQGETTVISRGEGVHVYDASGNRFLDGIGGLWCVNVGHGRDEIIDAIAAQMRELDYYSTFYNLTHPLASELSQKVTSMAPGSLNHVYFANSGSVANDSAVRILHAYFNRLGKPRKKKILSRIGAYHGSTYLAIAMTTPEYRKGWDSAEELVHHLVCPNAYREADGMNDDEFLDFLAEDMKNAIERIGAENIACFIAEPILGAGGVIVPPDGYHRRTREICSEYDIKYISDEVVTAFGRIGHMFSSQAVFGIEPDIITTAKGLTSGYQPMSATIISDEIFEVLSAQGAMFLHGMTYSGHPACAAAALANIAIMERESIPERVRTTGKIFEQGLRQLEDLDIVGQVRGSHFMMGLEFVRNKQTKALFDEEVKIGGRVAQAAQSRGLIIRPLGNMVVMSPPLVLTQEQIEEMIAVLRDSISAVIEDLKKDGNL
ncbi:MAG: aminotransferase [Gammaproteobacteria bacterium]|nr:MAG: aminotransferase [Gammaproteobacteria bacterium]UCH39937.1 MAG: aminotransferase [Gammaproteobacteria bacterium]